MYIQHLKKKVVFLHYKKEVYLHYKKANNVHEENLPHYLGIKQPKMHF